MLLTAQLFMIDWFSEPGPHLSISIDYFLPWLCATFKQHLFHVEESDLKKIVLASSGSIATVILYY